MERFTRSALDGLQTYAGSATSASRSRLTRPRCLNRECFLLLFSSLQLFTVYGRYQTEWAKLDDWTGAENPTSSPVALVASIATSAAPAKKLLPKSDSVDPNVALNAPLDSFTRTFTSKDVAL
jgi:hypothetical protein